MTARILLVDDHEIVREGIRTLITRSRPEWEICGEAGDGEEALEAVKTFEAGYSDSRYHDAQNERA